MPRSTGRPTTKTLRLPPLHSGQWNLRENSARFTVAVCGRRWGKTLYAVEKGADVAWRGGEVWWVAPDYPRTSKGWRELVGLIRQTRGCRIHVTDRIVTMPSGGWIQFKSAKDPDSLRSEGLDMVIIDECADVPERAWTYGLRPSLSDKRGNALLIGTAKGNNWFKRMYDRGQDPKFTNWSSVRMPTWSNPFIDPDEIDDARFDLPERVFRQEYGAEFVKFEGAVYETFDRWGPHAFDDLKLDRYHTFWGGIDFGYRNPCAMVVAGEDHDSKLDGVDEHYERRMKPSDVVEECRRLTKKWGVRQWWADPHSPDHIAELQAAGLPVFPCPATSGGQDTVTQWEIRLVAGRFEEDPPALRFLRSGCPVSIDEHESYRYMPDNEKSAERERPLKRNDHTVNAWQYLVHGRDEFGSLDVTGRVGGRREIDFI